MSGKEKVKLRQLISRSIIRLLQCVFANFVADPSVKPDELYR